MNEALRKELEQHYWNNENPIDVEGYTENRDQFYEMYEFVKPLLVKNYANKLESSFIGACAASEKAAFLWGYEHCLTMLGLNH